MNRFDGIKWTPDLVDEIMRRRGLGESAEIIARAINAAHGLSASRNAVIGAIFRNKHHPGYGGPVKSFRQAANVYRAPRQPRAPKLKLVKPEPAPMREVEPLPAELSLVGATPDRRKGQCNWPIGDPRLPSFTWCRYYAEEGKPYCCEHMRLAFVPGTGLRNPRGLASYVDLRDGRFRSG